MTKESSIQLMPQKRFYRSRAHCNPLSYNDGFKYPTSPNACNWEPHYPMVCCIIIIHISLL